ncbi:uncharacterized protein LOC112600978 [Melanaphis sacchari]|uniref:uncharacterized protein LOC112600978 n=1 Tax=Melanaphis sacchari TaxID=742174 RepID=UPI000DC14CE2|nr:uncharacterized protein LOC112600978 [Melanaphis sacchari]
MFPLPSDYVTAQSAGSTFAADYYGRLNVSAESVADMFTERSRYYSMDSLNGRPAVGRAGVVREVRRFLGTYSGGRRFAELVSVDAQTDGEDGGRRVEINFGRDDAYDYDYEDDDDDGGPHLAVFVHAELTDPKRRSLAPLPFVQMFRVRCLRDRFEITITVVKTMATTVRPLLQQQHHQLQRRHRQPDDDHRGNDIASDCHPLGFSDSERVEKDYETTGGNFVQNTYGGYTKKLNAEAREFELWSDVTSPPYPMAQSTDDERESSEEGQHLNSSDESWSIREQYLAYHEKVKEFLGQSTVDRQPQHPCTEVIADDDVGPTDRLNVDRLDKSVTADQLYAAFSRYGKVLWVRVLPGGNRCDWSSGSGPPYHSARVCFDRIESVDRVMADYRGPGCTINGVRVSFSKSKSSQ